METSAAQNVFDTPELLESILLQLPCLQLFTAQRVSTSWHGTVLGSPRLQEAVFLRLTRPILRLKNASADSTFCASNGNFCYIDPESTAASVYHLLSAETEYVHLNPFPLKILSHG